MKNLTFNTFYYTSPFIVFWLILGSYFSINIKFFISVFAISIVSYYNPKSTVYLLLVLLPIFGSRPCMEQTHYLIVLSGFLLIGVYINLFKNSYKLKKFKVRLLVVYLW